jgi:CRISP-associated protein Cas1
LLRIERGALTIRDGFTHYPQKQETYRFFKGELTIPPRIIMLDGSGSISFDVLAWLSEQNVPLIRIDWQGNVQSVLANNGHAANPYRVQWQRETRADLKRRMAFCIDLIARKIDGCIKTLDKSVRRSALWEKAMDRADKGQGYDRTHARDGQIVEPLSADQCANSEPRENLRVVAPGPSRKRTR